MMKLLKKQKQCCVYYEVHHAQSRKQVWSAHKGNQMHTSSSGLKQAQLSTRFASYTRSNSEVRPTLLVMIGYEASVAMPHWFFLLRLIMM